MVVTFNILLGLIMAEICSAYPTSGGVYFWSHRLGGEPGGLTPFGVGEETEPSFGFAVYSQCSSANAGKQISLSMLQPAKLTRCCQILCYLDCI